MSDDFGTKAYVDAVISIHAPARGATVHHALKFSSFVFQSTLPREERPSDVCHIPESGTYFNSHSHERNDGRYRHSH